MNPWKRRLLFVWYSLCFVFVGWFGFGTLVQFFKASWGLGVYPLIPPSDPFKQFEWFVYYIVMAIGILLFIPWSMRLLNNAKLYRRRSNELNLSDIQQNSKYNPYVLYLRSFDVDKVTSKVSAMYIPKTEEEILVQSLSPIGKTVAIGCPSDPIPPLGGYRIYVSDDEWQGTVKQLSKDAILTVLRLGQTQGVSWEIDYALTSIEDLQKLIFLIPDFEKINLTFFADLEKAIRKKRPDDVQITPCTFHKQGWGTVSSIIYFEKNENGSDSKPTYIMKQSFVPKRTIWNYFGNLSLAFQKAMFPIYKQFGKLSFMKKFSNAFLSYFLIPILIAFILIRISQSESDRNNDILWYKDCLSKIQAAEQKYPELANALKGRTNIEKITYISQETPEKILYLNDEQLVEILPAALHITKSYLYENKDPGDALFDLPKEEITKLSDNLLRATILNLVPEERENIYLYCFPDIYQEDNILKVCSSLTEKQKATVRNWISSWSEFTLKQKMDYLEFINGLRDKSIKAFLLRAFAYYNNKDFEQQ